jgi:hypothetical protein
MNMTQVTHAGVGSTCKPCHEAGLSFYMGAASPGLQGRPADHTTGQLVAPNDCNLCHTTANWNSTAMPAGHMPNPANQACTVCHTTAPADYSTATLAANATLHTGINSGCITCHGSPSGALTFYNNFTPKSAVLSPVHIPTATTRCEDCHSSAVFTAFSGTSMSSAKHTLMFATIGNTCDACHNRITPGLSFYGVSNLQTRPTDHNSGSKATSDCSHCHNPNSWGGGAQSRPASGTAVAGPKVLVPTVPGASPMGATIATASTAAGSVPSSGGPSLAAVPTRAFPHTAANTDCVSCHNGVVASGKSAAHIASNALCANCHTTIAWLPARFDHQGITARCASCHNGVVTAGKAISHIPSSLDCSSCHSTIAWQSARFTHSGTSGSCQSCHNALTSMGKSLGHVQTALDCGACHNTLSWTPAVAPFRQRPAMPGARAGLNGSGK